MSFILNFLSIGSKVEQKNVHVIAATSYFHNQSTTNEKSKLFFFLSQYQRFGFVWLRITEVQMCETLGAIQENISHTLIFCEIKRSSIYSNWMMSNE